MLARLDDVSLSLPEHLAQPLEGEPLTHYQVLEQLRTLEQGASLRPGDDTAEQAIERLDTARALHRGRKLRHAGLMFLALLLVTLAAVLELWLALPLATKLPHLPDFVRSAAVARVHDLAGPDAYFDPAWESADDWVNGTEKAWLEHPSDPEYYYFRSHIHAFLHRELPPDYDEVTRRLDPDNAGWDLLRADTLAWQAIDRRTGKTPDPALVAQSMATLQAASLKPRLTDYHQELARIYESSYHPKSIYERDLPLFHPGDSNSFLLYPYSRLSVPFQRDLHRSKGDLSGNAAFFHLAQKLLYRSALAGSYPSEPVVKYMADEADARGLPYDATRLRHFRDMCEAAQYGSDPLLDSAWHPASTAMIARLSFLGLAALLVVIAALLRLRFRPGRGSVNRAALCLEPLLTGHRPISLRTFISLVAIPLVIGPAFYFVGNVDGLIAVAPFIVILDFIILLQGMRTQIFRRLGCLGLRSSRLRDQTWNFAIIFLLVAATLFVMGGCQWEESNPNLFPVALLTCTVTLWISASAILGYSTFRSSLRHNLLARRMITVIPFAVIPLALLAGLLVPVERILVGHAWQHLHAERRDWESNLLAKNREALHWMLRELD
ncbi:MAG: hypothetical protein JWO82_1527 [Akkermansiaceae bacterium]|nr:hypothetical protein [Akkermansiaceae bacterium]